VKIAIVAPSPIPFLVGGAEKLFAGLFYNLLRFTNHQIELIKVPVHDQEFWTLIDGYQRVSQLDLKYFDAVISTKYPVWLVDHHNHHVYMQHTCRGVYDLYHLSGKSQDYEALREVRQLRNLINLLHEAPTRDILPSLFKELFKLRDAGLTDSYFDFPGPLTRAVVRYLDTVALNPLYIQSYSAISQTVADREGYFPENVPVRVFHHPTSLEGLHSKDYRYIFTASRLEGLKRIEMLIKAFMKTSHPIDLRLAGTGGLEGHLKDLTRQDKRIKFLGFISDTQLIDEYAGSLFVPFIPYNEDYGLITLEAMLSEKAVLSVHDSGGPSELVQDGVNGRIVDPTEEALSRAIAEMAENHENTISMGKKAKETVEHLNWEDFVKVILSDIEGSTQPAKRDQTKSFTYVPARKLNGKKKILIPSTFPVYPALGGGQRRVFNIAKELSDHYEVVVVSYAPISHHEITPINPSLREIKIPRSKKQEMLFSDLEKKFGQPAEDVALIAGYKENPLFLDVMDKELSQTDMVICCHPYLYGAVRDKGIPHIYDAHNVEFDLKRYILGEHEDAQVHYQEVFEIEKACAREAESIFAVSEEDRIRLCELYNCQQDKVTIVPNGVDLDISQKFSLSSDERKSLKKRVGLKKSAVVFVGTYHKPNIAALLEIIPIAKALKNVLFLIVGSVCNYHIEEIPNNVIMLGVLSESEKAVIMNAADLAINPVIHGGGSNLKLLEYSAYRLPIVSTPYGKRGYEFGPHHFFVGDISEFPTLIRKALSMDMNDLLAMAEDAFTFLHENYTWHAILDKSLHLLP
jgi:glycosyltransferase involved in cell wall biosynthesis